MPDTNEIDQTLSEGDNARFFPELRERISHGSVVPFVGAGLSVPFGYPAWSGVLRRHATDAGVVVEVETYVRGGKFEEAASLLAERLGPGFNQLLRLEFTASRLDGRTIDGPPRVLTKIFRGPVVTSNYDEVLERVYDQQAQPFARLVRPPDQELLCEAFSGNRHYLLQIHGHWAEASSRILTLEEYESYYGGHSAQHFDFTRGLPQALHLMFLSRSVLFLGCSLHADRYLQVLNKLQGDGWRSPPHFAVLERPKTEAEQRNRRTDLLRLNILPIFFPPGRFDMIEGIIERLAPEATSDEAAPAGAAPAEQQADASPLRGGPSTGATPVARPPASVTPRAPAAAAPLPRTRARSGAPLPAARQPGDGPRNKKDKQRSTPRLRQVSKIDVLRDLEADEALSADIPLVDEDERFAEQETRVQPSATGTDQPLVAPDRLIEAIAANRCVVFVGGGASLDSGLPRWSELVEDLIGIAFTTEAIDAPTAEQLRQQLATGDTFGPVRECRKHMPADALASFVRLRLDTRGLYSPTHERLSCVPFVAALTSNFDSFIELTRPEAKVLLPKDMAQLGAAGASTAIEAKHQFMVGKVHGSSDVPDSLVLGPQDYERWLGDDGYLSFLVEVLSTYTVFFYGHRIADPSIRTVLRAAQAAATDKTPRHYAFCWRHNEAERQTLREEFGLEPLHDPNGMTDRKALAFLETLHRRTRN